MAEAGPPAVAPRTLAGFVVVVLAAIAGLVLLGGTVLGDAASRATVLEACAWFTAHLVLIYGWLARARPEETVLRWYAAAATLWCVTLLMQIGGPGAGAAEALAGVVRLWFLCVSFGLVLRVAGLQRPWVDRVLGALALAALLVPLAQALDAESGCRVFAALHLIARIVGALVVLAVLRRLLRAPDRDLMILVGSGLVMMGVALDSVWTRIFPGAAFAHLATPVIGMAMALLLVSRLLRATRTAEDAAANLERTVEARTAELETRHAQVRRLEQDRALQDERERLMRDMHDGAGGQLVAALALLEAGDAEARATLGDRLRAALLELRLMIDSLDELEGDPATLVATFRARMQPVLDAAGIETYWRIDALPRLDDLGPRAALDVLRILQEAVTNALRHAGARRISIRAIESGAAVVLEVEDDGIGFDRLAVEAGRGLTNMEARAQALGGRLRVERGGTGTCVRLELPVAPAA